MCRRGRTINENLLAYRNETILALFLCSGITPMGSGWANPWAPWLRGTQACSFKPWVSWVVPKITPPGGIYSTLSHRHPPAPWHKVTPLFLWVAACVEVNYNFYISKKSHVLKNMWAPSIWRWGLFIPLSDIKWHIIGSICMSFKDVCLYPTILTRSYLDQEYQGIQNSDLDISSVTVVAVHT